MTVLTKAELRKSLRALHQGTAERDRQSALLCGHILCSDIYGKAQVIGGYMPLAREADITPVLKDALACGKTLVLPRCGEPPRMTLRRVTDLRMLAVGPYGLLEPTEDMEIIHPDALDLLLVPLEGIDLRGMRLGKGGGYYDCLLGTADVPTMGCALSWQWTERIPADLWDRKLHACADERGLHLFK